MDKGKNKNLSGERQQTSSNMFTMNHQMAPENQKSWYNNNDDKLSTNVNV